MATPAPPNRPPRGVSPQGDPELVGTGGGRAGGSPGTPLGRVGGVEGGVPRPSGRRVRPGRAARSFPGGGASPGQGEGRARAEGTPRVGGGGSRAPPPFRATPPHSPKMAPAPRPPQDGAASRDRNLAPPPCPRAPWRPERSSGAISAPKSSLFHPNSRPLLPPVQRRSRCRGLVRGCKREAVSEGTRDAGEVPVLREGWGSQGAGNGAGGGDRGQGGPGERPGAVAAAQGAASVSSGRIRSFEPVPHRRRHRGHVQGHAGSPRTYRGPTGDSAVPPVSATCDTRGGTGVRPARTPRFGVTPGGLRARGVPGRVWGRRSGLWRPQGGRRL